MDAKRCFLARLPKATMLSLINWEGVAQQAASVPAAVNAAAMAPAAAHAAPPVMIMNEAAMVVAAAASPRKCVPH